LLLFTTVRATKVHIDCTAQDVVLLFLALGVQYRATLTNKE